MSKFTPSLDKVCKLLSFSGYSDANLRREIL